MEKKTIGLDPILRGQIGQEMIKQFNRDIGLMAIGVMCGCLSCFRKAENIADWWNMDVPEPIMARELYKVVNKQNGEIQTTNTAKGIGERNTEKTRLA